MKAFLSERRWQAARLAATMFVVFMVAAITLSDEGVVSALVIAVGAAAGAALAARALAELGERQDE